MFAKVDIFNMALGHLGISKVITDVNEASLEASALRTFYNVSRNMIFRAVDWPFARTIKPLELVLETPNEEWNYQYQYPADCANFLKIVTGLQYEGSDLRAQHLQLYTDSGTMILSNNPEAIGEYIRIIENTGVYPPDFVLAQSYLLASLSAISLASGDPLKLGEKNLALYKSFLGVAAAANKNESHRSAPAVASTPSMAARR